MSPDNNDKPKIYSRRGLARSTRRPKSLDPDTKLAPPSTRNVTSGGDTPRPSRPRLEAADQGGRGPTPPIPATAAAAAVAIDTTLLANFTHQIINPLNGVVGTMDNLIDDTIRGDRQKQRLRAVRGQLVGTIELVRNLAYLSELSTQKGREGLKSTAVDVYLPKSIIEAAQFLQEMAKIREIDIHLNDQTTQYVVKGHPALLRQVFTNIVENGIKYGDIGTRISIEPRPQRRTRDLIVDIISDGPGFTTEERTRLFELGFRGTGAKDMRASGSGIGLFICKQILDLHDARIEAEYSRNSRKTIFRLRFSSFRIDNEATRKEKHRD